MGKTTIWKILCFYPLLPLHNGEKTMRKSCVKLYFGLATFCRGRGGTLNKLFKIPIIFCHWLSEIYKKNEFLCILFQKTQMCFNDPDYLMSHSVMNIMTANGAKMAKIKCNNNVFKLLLLFGTCSKRVITSTQWQMVQFA